MTNKCSVFGSFILLIGRLCFSLIFIIAGFQKLIDFNQYLSMMGGKAIPYAETMLVLAIIFELGGGLLVFFGLFTRFGALLLFIFIIPVTYYFHSFWTMDGQVMVDNVHHFLKNLAMLGGSLYIMACGAGHISIDGIFRKKCCQQKGRAES